MGGEPKSSKIEAKTREKQGTKNDECQGESKVEANISGKQDGSYLNRMGRVDTYSLNRIGKLDLYVAAAGINPQRVIVAHYLFQYLCVTGTSYHD